MKHILFAFILLFFACRGFAQKGFGVDGSIGMGRNDGDLVNALLLEGRVQFNDCLSLNLGVGLWNSGFKDSWKVDNNETKISTLYSVNSSKTLPSLQFGPRIQVPVFNFKEEPVRLFVEPMLYFLPFSAQTVKLKETYYDIKTDDLTGELLYKSKDESKTNRMKSDCNPRFYGGIQIGLAYEVFENVDLAISYGYTNLDLFKDLRGKTITDSYANKWLLNKYIPSRTDLQMISISFLVNFNLN